MIYLFLANGFEEIEALTPVDILRRAGKEIVIVSIGDITVTGSHGIKVTADTTIDKIDADKGEMFILPGGMPGADNLENCQKLCDILLDAAKKDKYLCAICAAPKVLGKLGILKGKNAVCYPGYEDKLIGATIQCDSVVTDKNIVTANGMGSSLPFALTIADLVSDKSKSIARGILYNG